MRGVYRPPWGLMGHCTVHPSVIRSLFQTNWLHGTFPAIIPTCRNLLFHSRSLHGETPPLKTTNPPGDHGSYGAFSRAPIQFLPFRWCPFQGKQYRSLYCYRSALSSVPAPINGFNIDIGHQPFSIQNTRRIEPFNCGHQGKYTCSLLISWASPQSPGCSWVDTFIISA